METIQINLFQFEELNPEAQKNALDWYRSVALQTDINLNLEVLEENLRGLLNTHKINTYKDLSLNYSLGYSQGDGASFTGCFKWKSYTITIKRGGAFYVHEKSTYINGESTKTGKEWGEKAEAEFKEIYLNICRAVAKRGYSIIEAVSEEEALSDNIKVNEYTFLESGKRF
jgi:hypothetical protein